MLHKTTICMIVVLLAIGYGQVVFSGARAVPKVLGYQGYLTDTLGSPIDDSLNMTFKIFDAETVGNELWSETQTDVPVEQGNFSLLLGSVNEIPDTAFTQGTDRWLEMIIEGTDTLQPRTRIASAAYAYTATFSDTAEYAKNAAADNDWVRGTPDSVLFTANCLGIARGGGDNMLYGDSVHTHTNLGVACTTGAVGSDNKFCTVAGGYDNIASGYGATVGGGESNTASSTIATVVGGFNNTASGITATVAGGQSNAASGWSATVGGGASNTASGHVATVGGYADTSKAPYGGVFSGYSNLAGDATVDTAAFVGGGYNNSATGKYATISGGKDNIASGNSATVGGGWSDTVNTVYGGVAAGYSNLAGDDVTDSAAFVGGGCDNSATAGYATVGGGYNNTASGYRATVGGGWNNTASWDASTVSGGYTNTTYNGGSTVGGGTNNAAINYCATVGGGADNTASYSFATVGGGVENTASGSGSTVAGGYNSTARADYSFAVGHDSYVDSAHSNSAAFNGQSSTASGQTRVGMISKASGSFTIDHPTEPMDRILNHYFIESPEMVLIYRGVAIIGSDGRAEVHLPDYFDALNKNPMVQLTGVGTPDVVYVAEKVTGNRFVIGGKSGTEVYWTVTGERKDQSAEITRILMPVEQLKEGDLAGHSLDDDFLAATMSQLERMGQAGKFKFRTAEGQENYERSLRLLEKTGPMERK